MTQQKPFKCEKRNLFRLKSPLLEYKKNVTSQCGEDGIIEQIFKIVEPKTRFFVEFGAWDGKHFSNCFNLATSHGWSGAFIEGNSKKYADLLANHGNNDKLKCINSFVEIEGENTLDAILARSGAPKEIDMVSIDIDGLDWFVWESMAETRPQLLVIEFNPTIPNDVTFVQAKDWAVSQGCSLLSLVELGKDKGYELVCCTAWNAFFVQKERFGSFGIENNLPYFLYQPVLDGRIFHGYDSTIHVLGMDRLLWGNISLSSEDFQVLPCSLRKWGDAQSRNP